MTPGSNSFRKLENFIGQLRIHHKKMVLKEAFTPLLGGLSFLLLALSLLILLEKSFYFTSGVKSVYWLLSITVSAAVFIRFHKNKSRPSFRTFYETALHATGQEKLLNAIDLYLTSSEKNHFTHLAIQRNIAESELASAEKKIETFLKKGDSSTQFSKHTVLFLAAALAAVTLIALFPGDSLRSLTFWKESVRPNPFVFEIVPGDTTALHGSALQLEAVFSEPLIPESVSVHFRTDIENNYRTRHTRAADSHRFTSREIELGSNLQYFFEMDGFASDTFYVNVQQQPGFESLITTVTPPGYTGLPQLQVQYPSTELSFYPGSGIRIQAVPNKQTESVLVHFTQEKRAHPLTPSDADSAIHSLNFYPSQSDTMTFAILDTEGLQNRNLYRTMLLQREDMPPVVVIREPSENIEENSPGSVDFIYEVTDDFGITRAELQWELQRAFTEQPQTGAVPLNTPRNGSSEQYRWDPGELDLRPRDVVSVRIVAWDNDEVSGYKSGESREILIQIPSLADFLDDIDTREQHVGDHLDSVTQQFETMEQDYQRFLERLRQNPEGGYEESQMLDNIQDHQDEIEETIQRLQNQFEELRSEIENNEMISDETRRSYQELQQLMDELDDPDLRRAMEELRRAMESLSPDQIEQALQNVSFNEQLYKERIERTIELFKQLQLNSRLENLASRYEDMAKRMQPETPMENNRYLEEMDFVSQDLESAAKQLDELDKNPPQRTAPRIEQLKREAGEQLSSIREELETLQQELQQQPLDENGQDTGQPPAHQQLQQQIADQMQQEADNFRSAIQEMQDNQLQVNLTALQRVLYTLLELSEQQELLTLNAGALRTQSQGFVELARLQDNIRSQFSIASDTLFQISSEIPGIPNQINKKKLDVERTLQHAVNQMADRIQPGATITTRESLGGMNDLASLVASLIDQLMDQQNNGGGSGMSMQQMADQLQNMSGDQQQLNQQLQELVNDIQGDRLSTEESERIDQMARQQNEIRRQIQKLRQDGALRQGDRALSELQRLLEEMEESINDMRGGITDPLMVQRQQNILSRMLSAEESLQQRGERDEREGTPTLDYDRSLPPEITLDELEQQIRARIQDPGYTSFTEEYRRIIERYFEELKKNEALIQE